MKAYKIEDDIVAANTEAEAVHEWCKLFEECEQDIRSVEEIDPEKFMVNYEQDDGTFEPGPLAHMMPDDDEPIVLITHDYC